MSVDQTLVDAVTLLEARELIGVAIADAALTITARHGRLAEVVEIGAPLTASLLPLAGQEAVLLGLKSAPQTRFELRNVSFQTADGMTPKLSIGVEWQPSREAYLVLLTRLATDTETEQQLAMQVRLRLIAEEIVVEKSAALERANADLRRANADLAEFAYIASHDLKAPMRALRYIAEEIEAAIADLAADPLPLLAMMRQQTRRMTTMLSGLLEYAKVGRKSELTESVDTAALIGDIISSLRAPPGLEVVVDGHWPVVDTLAAPLDLVLRNLVDNAIKHHDREQGRIEVTCQQHAAGLLIVVADDGPGIAPVYHEAAFKPFVKLDNERHIESSGIGLSIVRKAVEVAGGTIDLISDPPQRRGSVMRVYWPATPTGNEARQS